MMCTYDVVHTYVGRYYNTTTYLPTYIHTYIGIVIWLSLGYRVSGWAMGYLYNFLVNIFYNKSVVEDNGPGLALRGSKTRAGTGRKSGETAPPWLCPTPSVRQGRAPLRAGWGGAGRGGV